ncbi:hypothetical protein YQE_08327, partial [Dendroctonus ponderosae]
MGDLNEKFASLEIPKDIFKDIKYFITGEVHEKVEHLLKAGGAEHQNYFSDYVTHLIVGRNPEENDIVDANDVYEIPAVNPKWILMCVSLQRRIDFNPYLYTTETKLFSGKVFSFSTIREDRNSLWALITYNGGSVHMKLTRMCDYLVTGATAGPKYEKACAVGADRVKIVTPDWVMEAVKLQMLPDPGLFHPKLINWPRPVKPSEPTTAITGFEPDSSAKSEEKTMSDSTQALLEKLKQRMPWNQPVPTSSVSPTSSSDPVAPPNVVAPSYINKIPTVSREQGFKPPVSPAATAAASSFISTANHMPRSIVHHTANTQQQPMQAGPLNINRMIGQPNRPNSLQQLRGQLNTSQIHQQLLQQHIQQQSIIQRTSTGQINMNQQLLHQHLSQGQRQVIQNQLLSQQNLLNQQQIESHGQEALIQNQNAQFNQPMDISHVQNSIERSPSRNQMMSPPQHQNQLLSPQHQQIQSQMLQQSQQSPVNQLQQQQSQQSTVSSMQSQLIHQQQQQQIQNQLNQQHQERANQLLNQQQLNMQQERANQLQNQIIQGNQQQQQQQHITQQQAQEELQNQLLGPQSSQSSQMMQQNQQIIQHSQQLHQQGPNQLLQQNQANHQLIQQNQQQGAIIRQPQMLNQQQLLNQGNPQQTLLSLPSNHHLSQLSPQQLQQLKQLKREQQQLLSQTQNQLGNLNQQSMVMNQLNQQSAANGNQNQQIIGQNQHQQQIIQSRTIQQQQGMNQQLAQNQSFNSGPMNQHVMGQKQQIFGQQQIATSQHQQLIQSQQSVPNQGQFLNQSQFDVIQQQQQQQQSKLNHGNQNQMSVQTLNQQLQQQNLGQQLNQQLMQQSQQPGINPNLALEQSITAKLGLLSQQQGNLSQPTLNQQMNPQVIRTQFSQQVLVNQGQQGGVQRAQLNQQIWAQQQQQQQQQGGSPIQTQRIVGHVAVQQSPTNGPAGPRVQWAPGQQPGAPQRQFIQLDAHTHNQLQKMPPEQQALFVAKLQQKQRQQLQLAKQVQQRTGGHILIRGNVPQGLTPQQQVQWLQQQAKQQGIVLPPNIQQNLTPGNVTPQQTTPPSAGPPQHAPGLSPINQASTSGQAQQFVGDQSTAQQLQLRQQYRLQQLQLQREQAQKNAMAQQGGMPQQQAPVRPPLAQPPAADSTTNPQVQVNPKTKTALANMLSIKLQSGAAIAAPPRPEGIPEPSAAGTLRMMTAQHNAAINSKPQEIIALHQRRVINGPNGEIIKPPGVPTLPLTPQNEPPKLQYNQKSPVPVQHRVGPFYGHNPNLKLPPDLFLLGCIFVVVEVEDYLEEKLPGWQQKIEKYGGEIEKQYCNKVTHVLCETQKHGVVMQALRDLKRCVTIRWLNDVIKRKQVVPPWTALHLPQIYLDITPASKHLISISGFEGSTRQVVKQMVMYIGAKCTSYFSKHNTLLICSKAEGKKFEHAKKWGTPVVNVQWLTDILLGNFTAMNQMENQAYQTYSNPPNLSFDPKIVPNLMHAWKAPINISQDSYERVKRSASPVSLPKAKRLKTEHTDENENITEEVVHSNYRVLFSQFALEEQKTMEKMVRELGGIVAKDHTNFTHLVMAQLTRTPKLLFAVVKSCHILPSKWLEESMSAKNFLPEHQFSFCFEEFNRDFGAKLDKVLHMDTKHKLLEGKTFWITPGVFPSKKTISELIELSGGSLERIRRSRAQIEATSLTAPFSYFILTAHNDLHLVADLLKSKKDTKQRVVCNVELVLSAILSQDFQIDKYAVSVV